jgi:CHASE1-domain containing sensor protein
MMGKTPKTLLRFAPPDMKISKRLGGGVLKELALTDRDTGKVIKYALAYINPLIYAKDNGRVLGYDNGHGYAHRHYMGSITPEPFTSWEQLREKFEREWREIAMKFVNGEK